VPSYIDFAEINDAACRNGRPLVQELIPGGRFRSLEYIVRNPTRDDKSPGSFSVNYRTGQWHDFATGQGGGDFVSLVAYLRSCSQGDAALELAPKVGIYGVGPSACASHTRDAEDAGEGAQEFADDDGPPTQQGEIRRHVYRTRGGLAVKAKIKLQGGGWVSWYRLFERDKPAGWRAKKPDDYQPVPYVTSSIDPFDPELGDDQINWSEGEKDVDTLGKFNLPAFTFGGVGDGVPEGIAHFLAGRHLNIFVDNDDPGRQHAEKKAAVAHAAGAASIRIVQFPELAPKQDVSDYLTSFGGTIEQLKAKINASELWSPPTNAAEIEWQSPDWSMLEDRRGELPEFPVDALDPTSREFIARASHGAGVTPSHVIVPLLAVVSATIGTARRIEASRSWSEPATIWTAVIGFSGAGKTPGIDVVKRHLAWIDRQRRAKLIALEREHETKKEIARAATKKWKKDVEAALENGTTPPKRSVEALEPGEFIIPRLYVSDSTVEKVAVLLQARPYGLVHIGDELAGLFLNMTRYSGGSDREFWLEAWNGKPYVQERVNRPPVSIDHLLVGITGGLQPDKLIRSFQGDDDGLYARVCFAWPSDPKYRPLSNDVAEIEPDFVNALERIVDLAPTSVQERRIRHVPLTADALVAFENFRLHAFDRKDALDGREREWWAKGPTQVLRIALTLCFLSWSWKPGTPEPGHVDLETMSTAIRIYCDYFWPHARAALRQTGLTKSQTEFRRALKWMRSNLKPGEKVSLQQVRRDALAQSLDAGQTGRLMEGLARAGWLKRTKTATRGRPKERWEVNPLLFSGAGSAGTIGAQFAEAAE
jgi:hypothetical protein